MHDICPTYFISHGGGPWPWVPKMRAFFATLEESLKKMVVDHGEKPKAILMISGHWESDHVTIMASPKPPMLYDYYGFPEETYAVRYDAPGAPEFAELTRDLLSQAGFKPRMDTQRGFDHGVFAPMEVMYPKADVPLFQVSMLNSYDPADHLAMGRALSPLRKQGVMIVGSGLSFHSLQRVHDANLHSAQFDAWLYDSLTASPDIRRQAILDWEKAPSARVCHAKEDHLVPLFVALGAAEDEPATRIYHDSNGFMGNAVSNYRFG